MYEKIIYAFFGFVWLLINLCCQTLAVRHWSRRRKSLFAVLQLDLTCFVVKLFSSLFMIYFWSMICICFREFWVFIKRVFKIDIDLKYFVFLQFMKCMLYALCYNYLVLIVSLVLLTTWFIASSVYFAREGFLIFI